MSLHTIALAASIACAALPAFADEPDWEAVAGENTIQIITVDLDGATRDTTIWLAVVAGEGYIRTSGTRWFGNVEREPRVVVRIAGEEYRLRADLVADQDVKDRVEAVFREKYGLWDRLRGVYVWGATNIMRLSPRIPE
jgi:hypothetical protein